MHQYIYIGAWGADIQGQEKSQEAQGGGVNIYRVQEDGSLAFVSNHSPEVNAGIIHITADHKFLYATDERKDVGGRYGAGGAVCAFRISQDDGELTFLNSVSSVGAYPCYVTADRGHRFVFICNHGNHDDVVTKAVRRPDGGYETARVYDDGGIAMFPVKGDGSLGQCCDLVLLSGSSTVERFQWSPHPHSVCMDPSDRFLLCGDKGSDHILVFEIDYAACRLKEAFRYASPPGTGPRHIAFHPALPIVYVNSEIDSTVHAFHFNQKDGSLGWLDSARTIPDPYTPPDPLDMFARNAPADLRVHPSGRFLYVSNRGHNTIASYRLGADGRLQFMDWTPCGGQVPRAINFSAHGDKLYSVNQRSGTVVEFLIDAGEGALHPSGRVVRLGNPVCLQAIEM